ncbi:MAG: T9SS type A sorting domain-containing protein [Bacteroidetes bacterium]|nr:T9SS type A sorting domain-containing protein [Bacteroidota bacterium]
MRIFSTFILSVTILAFLFKVSAQEIGIGEWRDHLPYYTGISVTEAGSRIYCATSSAMFYYDKEDNSVQRVTKVSGLSDVGISVINFTPDVQTLVIAYTNTNIDLIKDNQIINISDIKRKPILGNKTINNVTFRDKYAYLSCGFGIVVLDIDKEEIYDTYYIGPEGGQINIWDISFDDHDSIYAATESGIYKASLESPNLADYNSWTKDMSLPLPDVKYNFIEYFSHRIFTNYASDLYGSDSIYVHTNGSWQRFDPGYTTGCQNITSMYNRLVIANNGNVDIYDTTMTRVYFTYLPSNIGLSPLDAIIDKDAFVWIADRYVGLVKTYNSGWTGEVIHPNGPKSPDVFDMSVTGKDVWVVPGGRDGSWNNIWKTGRLFSFIDNEWKTLDAGTVPELDPVRDMVCVAVDPADEKRVYAGSWGYGLFEFFNRELAIVYTDENSSLQPFTGTEKINIGGLCFDDDNNLWVANSNAGSVLSVRSPDGTWQALNLGSLATGIDIGELIIDMSGQKWMLVRDHGLVVFNDNNTISDPSDDRVQKLNANAGNGSLPGLKILSFAVDQDGELWMGSDEGVAVIYSPENVFTGGNYDAQRILVIQDGYVQYLLETEAVTAITIDGANQKWFGTDKAGVFLMSSDGTKQLLHFTEENSPLLSNSITSIVINNNGEVFFGTSKGVISYRSTATPPKPVNNNVYAYPNPVREDYDGPIAIKGLVQNADVKITDVSGTLIYATKAQGGQAIWNGRNFEGDKAHTGVYMVYISNEDGSETIVTKILVIN